MNNQDQKLNEIKQRYQKFTDRFEIEKNTELVRDALDDDGYIREFAELAANAPIDIGILLAEIEHLSIYQKAEHENRLVMLPCPLGAKLHDISEIIDEADSPEIYELDANKITIIRLPHGNRLFEIDYFEYKLEDFGVVVFEDIEAAERRADQIAKERNNHETME